MVYVQLTEEMTDIHNDDADIRSRRERFKAHFPCNAFFLSGQGYDRLQRGPEGDVFSVPNFELSDE